MQLTPIQRADKALAEARKSARNYRISAALARVMRDVFARWEGKSINKRVKDQMLAELGGYAMPADVTGFSVWYNIEKGKWDTCSKFTLTVNADLRDGTKVSIGFSNLEADPDRRDYAFADKLDYWLKGDERAAAMDLVDPQTVRILYVEHDQLLARVQEIQSALAYPYGQELGKL